MQKKYFLYLKSLIRQTVNGMGFEICGVTGLMSDKICVFIKKHKNNTGDCEVKIKDCISISKQLKHVLIVERVDFKYLEVSSRGAIS